MKVLDLVRNFFKGYNPPNIKLVFKDLLNVIHDQNRKRKWIMINKEVDVFGLLLLGVDAKIYRTYLLNILVSGRKIQWQF